MIRRVGIIGRGAVGVLFGSLIQEKIGRERLCFIADRDRAERYEKEPIICNGQVCDFRYESGDADTEPVDLLLIVVKGPALSRALESVRPFVGEHTVILSLLNGITSETIIEESLKQGIVLHGIAQLMDAVKHGNQVSYTRTGEIVIGTDREEKETALAETEQFFQEIGLPHHRAEDIIYEQWSKLMLNCGINQICAVYDVPYGGCQQPGELRELLIAVMEEVRGIANLEGIPITEEEIGNWVAAVDRLSPEAMPSMRQDMLAKRRTEVDLFSRTIIGLGKKHGVSTPLSEMLYESITEKERQF